LEVRHLPTLLELARAGAREGPLQLTSGELARKLGVSQQTAARWLVELETRGLIKRSVGARKQSIHLSEAGIRALRSLQQELAVALAAGPRVVQLTGRVVSGLGEGSYYMCQEGYRSQFKRELGFDPYPGTLDVKLDAPSLERRATLEGAGGRLIEGFATPERSFGQVKCFQATLAGIEAAVVMPARTHHVDTIELISPVNLRRKLKLKDGDTVRVEVGI